MLLSENLGLSDGAIKAIRDMRLGEPTDFLAGVRINDMRGRPSPVNLHNFAGLYKFFVNIAVVRHFETWLAVSRREQPRR